MHLGAPESAFPDRIDWGSLPECGQRHPAGWVFGLRKRRKNLRVLSLLADEDVREAAYSPDGQELAWPPCLLCSDGLYPLDFNVQLSIIPLAVSCQVFGHNKEKN